MNLKSRSDWLKASIFSPSHRILGRKRFTIRKNEHHFDITDSVQEKSLSPINSSKNTKRLLNDTFSATPKPRQSFKVQVLNGEFYRERLRAKNEEIKLLKELFKESTKQLLNAGNGKIDVLDKNGSNRMINRIIVQPKFTKSKPKVIFTNPITGILPKYNAYK